MAVQSVHAFAEKVALVTDGANPNRSRGSQCSLLCSDATLSSGFSGLSEENTRVFAGTSVARNIGKYGRN